MAIIKQYPYVDEGGKEHPELVKHYSDEGKDIIQVETGSIYTKAIDKHPCRFTYLRDARIARRRTDTREHYNNLKIIVLFPETPSTLGSTNAIPTTISTIYVPQSSKESYKTATNWTMFANKIVSDNLYLSFVRFNQKNKEYIAQQIKLLQEYIDGRL